VKLSDCELCRSDGGTIVLANEWLRVVLVDEPNYPGYVRVIWNDHVREMTELDDGERDRFMRTVFAVESAQREVLEPLKINLASLGNMTPHLHWHVISRFADDLHYPQPVWGTPQRTPDEHTVQARRALVDRLRDVLAEQVSRVT
jgi:diadenosine tetraphosphate (Ap4A) HIT family hydrolase